MMVSALDNLSNSPPLPTPVRVAVLSSFLDTLRRVSRNLARSATSRRRSGRTRVKSGDAGVITYDDGVCVESADDPPSYRCVEWRDGGFVARGSFETFRAGNSGLAFRSTPTKAITVSALTVIIPLL